MLKLNCKTIKMDLNFFGGEPAFGAVFVLGSTTVSEMTEIDGPGLSRDSIDMSSHDTSDGYMEFKPQKLNDPGELSIRGNFDESNASEIKSLVETTTVLTGTLDYPTSPSTTRFTSSMFVTNYEPSAPYDGKIEYSMTVKLTGKPELGQI